MRVLTSTILALLLTLSGQWQIPMSTGATAGGSAPATKPSYIQSCVNYVAGTTSSISCTFASAVTAGDQIYACGTNDSSFTFSLTGDSGTWTADPNLTANYTGYPANYTNCSYLSTAGGGETTLTLTESGLGYIYLNAVEIRNGVFDTSDAGATNVGSPVSGNSITTSAANDLVLGYANVGGSSKETCTAGTNFAWILPSTSVIEPTNGGCTGIEYYVYPSAAAISVQMVYSATSNQGWASHIAAFKPK